MDHSFWHDKWEKNQLGFHQPEGNSLFTTYFPELNLEKGARVFLPLCGKTRDIAWLLDQGYVVTGCELSEHAIQQLFEELEATPEISESNNLTVYRAPDLEIFVGDFFDLTAAQLGQVDAVYDRAAYVALPEEMRKRYGAHLSQITDKAPMLLITFEYDQNQLDGPPFSITDQEVHERYGSTYKVTKRTTIDLENGLRENCPATETVWLLDRL